MNLRQTLLMVIALQGMCVAADMNFINLQISAGSADWKLVPGSSPIGSKSILLSYERCWSDFSAFEFGFGICNEERSGMYKYNDFPDVSHNKKYLILPALYSIQVRPVSFLSLKMSIGYQFRIMMESYLMNVIERNSGKYDVTLFYEKLSGSPTYEFEIGLGPVSLYFFQWHSYPASWVVHAGPESQFIEPGEKEWISGLGLNYSFRF